MQQKLETLLARKMIEEDLAPGTVLKVDYDGRQLNVEAMAPAESNAKAS